MLKEFKSNARSICAWFIILCGLILGSGFTGYYFFDELCLKILKALKIYDFESWYWVAMTIFYAIICCGVIWILLNNIYRISKLGKIIVIVFGSAFILYVLYVIAIGFKYVIESHVSNTQNTFVDFAYILSVFFNVLTEYANLHGLNIGIMYYMPVFILSLLAGILQIYHCSVYKRLY